MTNLQNYSKGTTRMRPLGRLKRRWKDNITMDVNEIAVSMRNWMESQGMENWRSLVNTILNQRVS